MLSPQRKEIINNRYRQPEQQSERSPGADVADSECHSQKREHKTRRRKRNPFVNLSAPLSLVRFWRRVGYQLVPAHLLDLNCFAVDAGYVTLLFFRNLDANGHLVETRGGIESRLIVLFSFLLFVDLFSRSRWRLCSRDWSA